MPLTVENEGIATRDFIFVDDIVRGLMLCATKGTAGEVYNLANGVETSILELATTVNELPGIRRPSNSCRRAPGTIRASASAALRNRKRPWALSLRSTFARACAGRLIGREKTCR
jgi:nucleoside-diphosphate-sugar epimerase